MSDYEREEYREEQRRAATDPVDETPGGPFSQPEDRGAFERREDVGIYDRPEDAGMRERRDEPGMYDRPEDLDTYRQPEATGGSTGLWIGLAIFVILVLVLLGVLLLMPALF